MVIGLRRLEGIQGQTIWKEGEDQQMPDDALVMEWVKLKEYSHCNIKNKYINHGYVSKHTNVKFMKAEFFFYSYTIFASSC